LDELLQPCAGRDLEVHLRAKEGARVGGPEHCLRISRGAPWRNLQADGGREKKKVSDCQEELSQERGATVAAKRL